MVAVDEKKDGHPPIAPTVEHFTAAERAARGRAARAEAPHEPLDFDTPPDRDPVAILEAQASAGARARPDPLRADARLAVHLLPRRRRDHGADLAPTPRAGLKVQLCGDAHLSNFGGFASPERALVFDLNDFDETLPGPFEWDVKRLAASFEIAGRDRDFTDGERTTACSAVARVPRVRCATSRRCATSTSGTRGSTSRRSSDEAARASRRSRRPATVAKAVAKARTKDSLKAFAKLTQVVDGELRIVCDPPLIVPVEDLARRREAVERLESVIHGLFRAYRRTLQPTAATCSRSSARRPRPQGRRRRQRRDALLDRPAARPRRERPAVPPGQGGAGVGARAVPRQERVREPRPARRRRASG